MMRAYYAANTRRLRGCVEYRLKGHLNVCLITVDCYAWAGARPLNHDDCTYLMTMIQYTHVLVH